MIEDLLKSHVINYNLLTEDRYFYNNNPVPRVTELLSEIHEEYLMLWANSLGFRRRRYKDELEMAAYIGTNVHEFIEQFLIKKEFNELTRVDTEYFVKINNAVNSFIMWYSDVSKNNNIEILGMEQKLVCPWFGGTYDVLLKINGKIYLGDFKTSNHVGYKYFLQLTAYKYMLEYYYNTKIDGCLILQLDKNCVAYEEYFLDFSNIEHLNFINQCTTTFLSLVYTYYNKLQTIDMYKNIFKKRG